MDKLLAMAYNHDKNGEKIDRDELNKYVILLKNVVRVMDDSDEYSEDMAQKVNSVYNKLDCMVYTSYSHCSPIDTKELTACGHALKDAMVDANS